MCNKCLIDLQVGLFVMVYVLLFGVHNILLQTGVSYHCLCVTLSGHHFEAMAIYTQNVMALSSIVSEILVSKVPYAPKRPFSALQIEDFTKFGALAYQHK